MYKLTFHHENNFKSVVSFVSSSRYKHYTMLKYIKGNAIPAVIPCNIISLGSMVALDESVLPLFSF